MKKLLALCLTAVLCLCCLASCGSAHKENEWFSEEKLTNFFNNIELIHLTIV